MNRMAFTLLKHPAMTWAAVLLAATLAGVTAFQGDRAAREGERLDSLKHEADRSAAHALAQTLNGPVMGAVRLIGLIDTNIKQNALGATESDDGPVITLLGKIGRAIGAQCMFVVGEDGTIRAFWDHDGQASSGFDARLKPYYQMALKGKTSVYASVDLAHVDQRALYYAAPIFSEVAVSTVGSGAIVACSNAVPLDRLLEGHADEALLVSPHGVVFASKNIKWLGMLAAEPTQQRLADIRSLKQFGNFFGYTTPRVLPVTPDTGIQSLENRRYAVASSTVSWNDPAGNWRLMLMEDLSSSVPTRYAFLKGALAATLVLLLARMGLHILRARQTQEQANQQLRSFAERQQADVQYRAALAAASMRLQHCDRFPALAQVFLSDARSLLGAVQGVLYVLPPGGNPHVLSLAGHAACAEAPPEHLALGQGLLGQCALELRAQVIPTPPEAFWTVRSGLGEVQPAALLLTPILMQDTLIGALELALLSPPDDETMARFDALIGVLANALEILRRHLDVPATGQSDPTEVNP